MLAKKHFINLSYLSISGSCIKKLTLYVLIWGYNLITIIVRSNAFFLIYRLSLYFENGCWKVTPKILDREIKNILLHLVFYFTLKKCIVSSYYCLQKKLT